MDDVIIKLNEQETRLLTKEGVLELLKICASKTNVSVAVVRSDPAVKTSQVTQEDKDRKKAEPNEPKQALPSATPQRPAGVTNYINGRKMTDTLILKANKVHGHVCRYQKYICDYISVCDWFTVLFSNCLRIILQDVQRRDVLGLKCFPKDATLRSHTQRRK